MMQSRAMAKIEVEDSEDRSRHQNDPDRERRARIETLYNSRFPSSCFQSKHDRKRGVDPAKICSRNLCLGSLPSNGFNTNSEPWSLKISKPDSSSMPKKGVKERWAGLLCSNVQESAIPTSILSEQKGLCP